MNERTNIAEAYSNSAKRDRVSPKNRETGETLILKEEVEKAIRMLKNVGSPAVNNILADILKYGEIGVINALTVICQKICTRGQWIQSLTIPLPKTANTLSARTTERLARLATRAR